MGSRKTRKKDRIDKVNYDEYLYQVTALSLRDMPETEQFLAVFVQSSLLRSSNCIYLKGFLGVFNKITQQLLFKLL